MIATTLFAVASSPAAAENSIRSFITPILATFVVVAGLLCTIYLIVGAYNLMTSAGNPDKHEHAKSIIRNALIGYMLVIGATAITALLSHALGGAPVQSSQALPNFQTPSPVVTGGGLGEAILKAVVSFLKSIVQSAISPVMNGLSEFLNATPLMRENNTVVSLYVVIAAIANVLFAGVACLIGFHIMSANVFGYEEQSPKFLIPRMGLIFILMNGSIYVIDWIIRLANAIVDAIRAGVPSNDLWKTLATLTDQLSGNQGIITLLLMVAMAIFGIILYVYYIKRILILFVGAVMAPLVVLLCLLPAFRDFAISAIKQYIGTIFVVLIHVVILTLAASLLVDIATDPVNSTGGIGVILLGIAAMSMLLGVQGVMNHAGYATAGLRSTRKLGVAVAKNTSALAQVAGAAAYAKGSEKLNEKVNEARTKMLIMQGGASPKGKGTAAFRDYPASSSAAAASAPAKRAPAATAKNSRPATPPASNETVNAKKAPSRTTKGAKT